VQQNLSTTRLRVAGRDAEALPFGRRSEAVSGCRNTEFTEQTTACDGNSDVAKG